MTLLGESDEVHLEERVLMRTLLLTAVMLFAIGIADSQTSLPQESFESRFVQRPSNEHLLFIPPLKPNEVTVNGMTYEGIFVQMAKTPNPLQLINPAASLEYGSSDDNTVFDPITGNASGLKLFSVRF